MAYNRLHIDGTLAGGAEEWSTSFACATATGTATETTGDLSAWCDGVLARWTESTGWPGDLRSMLGATSAITKIRAYWYPTIASAAAAAGESSGAAVNGSGSALMPLQSSLVYTLQTGVPGRSFRGRMYWPFLSAVITTGGKITTSSVSLGSRASSFADMLTESCAESPVVGLVPQVVSKTRNLMTPVNSVRVGDIMDTQRRRRDALVEAFGTAPV